MDPDRVVERLIGGLFLLGGALIVGAAAMWFVGRLGRRARAPGGITLLAQLLTPIALFYAASLYFDVAGTSVEGRVTSMEEKISHNSRLPGAWSRSLLAGVSFTGPDGPELAMLWLDAATYDALRPDASIVIRYVPWVPFVARPADRSTLSLVPWRWLAIGGIVLAACFAVRPLLRRAPAVVQGLAILGAIFVAAVWLIFPTPWDTPLEPPVRTAVAEVRYVNAVTLSLVSGEGMGSVPAPQPWDLVELQFVPEGRERPVIAVDDVDTGSVPGLEVGARLPVTYSERNPRDVRLAGARTYRVKEWGELGESLAAAVAVLGGLLLVSKAAGGWWRRLTRPRGK